jgi:hypothetical protein
MIKETEKEHYKLKLEMEKAFSKKECMVPDSIKSPCYGKCSKSHIVSRAASVEQIAIDGHVYRFSSKRIPDVEKKGYREVPIFYGFCNNHDTEIFSPIESIQSPINNAHEFNLLAYRALCSRLYNKRRIVEKAMDGRYPKGFEKVPVEHIVGSQLNMNNLEYYKTQYDSVLFNENSHEKLLTLVIKSSELPPVMGATFILPSIDLYLGSWRPWKRLGCFDGFL